MDPRYKEKRSFLLKQIGKGFIFLSLLILFFMFFESKFPSSERDAWFGKIYDNVPLVMLTFLVSEVFFGIIPPEVFMLWSLRTEHLGPYFLSVGILASISYLAGAANFHLGRWIKDTQFFVNIRKTRLKKTMLLLEKYGGYLIVVASVTPMPFAAVALLSGAGNVTARTYYLYSLWRIVRYFVYAWILYETSS